MSSPAPHRSRALPDGPIRWAILALALALTAAVAQSAPATAPSEVVNLYRLEARARAAASLSTDARTEDARAQLDAAASGPLAALTAGGDFPTLRGPIDELRTAVLRGDGRAAREAASRVDAIVGHRVEARLTDAEAVHGVLVALVREAGREGLEGADTAGGGASTEPQAYASALADVALALARAHGGSSTARDALTTLRSTLGAPGASGAGADVIRSATDNALAAMGAPPNALDTRRLFEAIDRDLDLAEARYRAGDAAGAREALIDAYLENFEALEPPLEAVAPDLEVRLEHTLRDALRSLVAQGVPPDRFEAAVKSARTDLARARQVLQ